MLSGIDLQLFFENLKKLVNAAYTISKYWGVARH
jgi:hypothetical protein